MKQSYFTKENIDTKAGEMLSYVNRRPLPEKIEGKLALLILDMQDYFLLSESHAYVPSTDAIIGNIQKLVSEFEKKDRPVICTQHINKRGEAGMMEEWWDDLLTEDHLHKNLSRKLNFKNCSVIKKSQYDAFYNTELLELLKSGGVTDVAVTGVMTHLCCETTARSAFVHGFRVWFLVDGTATYRPEYHMSSISNLSHGFVYPILTDELIGLMK